MPGWSSRAGVRGCVAGRSRTGVGSDAPIRVGKALRAPGRLPSDGGAAVGDLRLRCLRRSAARCRTRGRLPVPRAGEFAHRQPSRSALACGTASGDGRGGRRQGRGAHPPGLGSRPAWSCSSARTEPEFDVVFTVVVISRSWTQWRRAAADARRTASGRASCTTAASPSRLWSWLCASACWPPAHNLCGGRPSSPATTPNSGVCE